jgi:pyrroline-5-carboxylate reductase
MMAGILNGLKIGFLGAGAMAEAMMRGLAGSGAILLASDPDAGRRDKVASAYGVRAIADNREIAAEARVVVLAVKPQVAPAVLAEVGGVLRAEQRLLSIVAGLRLDAIAAAIPAKIGLTRAMPNVPALIGAGITGVAAADRDEAGEELAGAILAPLGKVVFLPESLLDAVTGLSGSGPAYVALFAEALIEGGVKAGLPRQTAVELAIQTLLGSAKLLAGGESPAALRERVTSPGGTTAFGLYALERGGLRAAVIEAVAAAADRAAALGACADKSKIIQ